MDRQQTRKSIDEEEGEKGCLIKPVKYTSEGRLQIRMLWEGCGLKRKKKK